MDIPEEFLRSSALSWQDLRKCVKRKKIQEYSSLVVSFWHLTTIFYYLLYQLLIHYCLEWILASCVILVLVPSSTLTSALTPSTLFFSVAANNKIKCEKDTFIISRRAREGTPTSTVLFHQQLKPWLLTSFFLFAATPWYLPTTVSACTLQCRLTFAC